MHRRLVSRRASLKDEIAGSAGGQFDSRVCVEQVEVRTTDPDTTPRPHGDVPGRAIALLDDEFQRLRSMPIEPLLEEVPELRKLFDDLRLLDSVQPGRRDELQAASSWAAYVDAARELLDAELGEAAGDAGEAP